MASVRKEVMIDAPPTEVWAALRDWGAPHDRLVRGFVVDCRLDGADRVVTFFTGTVLRERLIDLDDDARRLAWSIVEEPYSHHNGVAQVFDADGGRTRFVWVTDLLPDEMADRTGAMMDRGIAAIRATLEPSAAPAEGS